MIPISNDQSGAILTIASSLTCILGSLVIYSDLIWKWLCPSTKFTLNNNENFLVCSLSLSSGILLFTSMYKLLPQGLKYFKKVSELADKPEKAHFLLIIMFFVGIFICSLFNMFIHAVTSKSVVHCAHDGHSHKHNHGHTHDVSEGQDDHGHDHDHAHDHSHSHNTQIEGSSADTHNEHTPLLLKSPRKQKSLIDITDWKLRRKMSVGKCMGYSSLAHCEDESLKHCQDDSPEGIYDYRDPETGEHQHEHLDPQYPDCSLHRNHSTASFKTSNDTDLEQQQEDCDDLETEEEELHHHHVSTRYSHLFSIGAQTAFAISVHKVPEGILTFATSHANKELGFSVFLSLAIHNFSEGFTIAFPLFLALGSRSIALTASIILGGLSQPFGAFLAWLFFRFHQNDGGNSPSDESSPFIFGTIVSISAGFLCIIGFQMYGTAISFGGSQRMTMFCAFLGIALIGTAYSLTAK